MSLCVKLYNDSDKLFRQNFWSETQTLVICPSPAEADRVRARLINADSTDVITISKFISNQLEELENPLLLSRKSDLMLKLSVFWKRVYPEHSFERFSQCFTLLTELRGTSVELDSLQEVINEYHPDVAAGISMLWSSMQATQLNDEHSAYSFLAESHRKSPSPFQQNEQSQIVFFGFAHLSGVQIDLLKAIALRHEVIVPYRFELYQKRHASDWISWLSTDSEPEVLDEEIKVEKEYPLYTFSKNRLSECLKKMDLGHVEVILGTSNPALRDYLEIPINNLFFKSPVDVLSESFVKIENDIRISLAQKDHEQIPIDEIEAFLKKKIEKSIIRQDFKDLKAIQLTLEVLDEWKNLASVNSVVSTFDWEVIRQSVRLNSPRVYYAPNLSLKEPRGKIRSFSESADIKENEDVLLCLTSAHASPKLGEAEYSKEVSSLLASLGPKRRKELDFLKLREEFREVTRRTNVTFVIENGLLEHDLGWAEMLSGYRFESVQLNQSPGRVRRDILNARELKKVQINYSLSPSRLQTYSDCPRQFYYQYIENVADKPIALNDLSPSLLGEVEHDVIAKYLEKLNYWDESEHSKICSQVIAKILSDNKIELDAFKLTAHFSEVKMYSKSGILLVLKLMESLPECELSFEELYEDGEFKGRVDLILTSKLGMGILDFKRSAASVPTKTKHESFEKLQLWNYLAHANKQKRDLLFWGYVSLKDISQSLLYSSWDELIGIFDDVFDDVPKINSLGATELNIKIDEYKVLESELLASLKSEEHWPARPTSSDACTFCAVNTLCSRGLV